VCVASLVVLLATVVDCTNCKLGYELAAIVCSIISFVLTFLLVALSFGDPSMVKVVSRVVSVMLAVLWTVCACVITFKAPFNEAGNGYFASWSAVGLCYSFMAHHFKKIQVLLENHLLFWRGFASIVLLVQAIVDCAENRGNCEKHLRWGIACGTGGFFYVFIEILLMKQRYFFRVVMAAFNLFWWIAGVTLLTFEGAYSIVGNGYLSVWMGVTLSFLRMLQLSKEPEEDMEPETQKDDPPVIRDRELDFSFEDKELSPASSDSINSCPPKTFQGLE